MDESWRRLEKHFVATGFVLNCEETKMLMVYHRKLDRWAAPGGHIEENELPEDAALREVFEETGIKAEIKSCSKNNIASDTQKEVQLSTPYVILGEYIPKNTESETHIHIDLVYLCEAEETETLKQEAEVKAVKWMTWDEIVTSNTFSSVKNFARTRLCNRSEQ